MRAIEFITEKKKRKKRKVKAAAWGPGPYGGYGYAAGYSSDSGDSGGVGENINVDTKININNIIDTIKNDRWKQAVIMRFKHDMSFKDIGIEFGVSSSMARMLVSQGVRAIKHSLTTTNDVNEGWRDWVGGAALGAAVATGAPSAYNAVKDFIKDKPDAVQQQHKNVEINTNAVPKKSVTGNPHEKVLVSAAIAAGIKGEELAQFLGQCAHETGNFDHLVELGGSLDFKKYEPKFVKDKKTKKIVQVNPKAKTLGNKYKGDGARYKGRGYIQLTGRYNYKTAGEALGLPLEDKPDLVAKPEVAAKVAVWFWQNRVQPRVNNFNNTRAATKPINPGLKGLENRKEKFQDFKMAMR